jgi:hypothetical protein
LHNWLDAYQPIDLCRRPATPIGVAFTGFAAEDSDIYIRSTFPVGIKVVGTGTRKMKREWLARRAVPRYMSEYKAKPNVLAATMSIRLFPMMAGAAVIESRRCCMTGLTSDA